MLAVRHPHRPLELISHILHLTSLRLSLVRSLLPSGSKIRQTWCVPLRNFVKRVTFCQIDAPLRFGVPFFSFKFLNFHSLWNTFVIRRNFRIHIDAKSATPKDTDNFLNQEIMLRISRIVEHVSGIFFDHTWCRLFSCAVDLIPYENETRIDSHTFSILRYFQENSEKFNKILLCEYIRHIIEVIFF